MFTNKLHFIKFEMKKITMIVYYYYILILLITTVYSFH